MDLSSLRYIPYIDRQLTYHSPILLYAYLYEYVYEST